MRRLKIKDSEKEEKHNERSITNVRDDVLVFNFICGALHRIVGISVVAYKKGDKYITVSYFSKKYNKNSHWHK